MTAHAESNVGTNHARGGEPSAMRKLKVVLLGDRKTGKKSVVRRLLSKPFEEAHCETLGVEVSCNEVLALGGSEVVVLELWTCSGAPRYVPIVQQNYRGAHAVILVYDASRPESLERCMFWRNEALRAIPNAPIILVRNKVDTVGMEGTTFVSDEAHDRQAELWGVKHFRTSCKTGEGIESLQGGLLRML